MVIHVPLAARHAVALLLSLVALTLSLSADAQTATSLQWRSYVGGPGADRLEDVARLSNGDIVVVGNGTSTNINEPAGGTVDTVDNYFIARFSADGTVRRWSHVYGANTSTDRVTAIAVTPTDELFIVGSTDNSNVTDSGTLYDGSRGGQEGFLAKVSSADGFPEWFLYLSGSGTEAATGVLATGGFVYVTGYTTSTTNFLGYPVPGSGAEDAFVVKVDPSQIADSTLRFPWTTKPFRTIGGSGQDLLSGITLDVNKLLLVGTTRSSSITNIPTPVVGFHGDADAFVAKMDPVSGSIDWFTYVGGTLLDEGNAITVNPTTHQSVIAGSSTSNLLGPVPPGGKNAFAVWLGPTGAQIKTRVLGGGSDDEAVSVALDGYDHVYIAGTTASSDLPVTSGPALDTTIEGGSGLREGFMAVFPSTEGPGWVSFFGGDLVDSVGAMFLYTPSSRILLAMQTASTSGLPPPLTSAGDTTLNGGSDGYLAVLNLADMSPIVGGVVNDRSGIDNINVDIDVLDFNDRIYANWNSFTHGSTLRYAWAIGTAAAPEAVQPFTSVDVATAQGRTGLSLQVGTTYFVSVRAQTPYGIASTKVSDGVLIRSTGTPDAGMDGGTDAGPDAGADAGPPDAGPDAGVDAGPDAGADAGPDAGADAGLDAGMDAGADAGPDAGADAGPDAGADAGMDAGADAGPGADGGISNDAGVDGGERISPIGCSCSSEGGAGLPLLFGLMLLVFLSRRASDTAR
ncbi:hypothetical protein [Hyalangium versicolor]|uniref:hypothetical protein n=1 Tax=Hyalangium versicolor TaxID=2861190 RepID=UPI001CCD0A8E|nr:hypothetical protein [Hyalangium versicolor]